MNLYGSAASQTELETLQYFERQEKKRLRRLIITIVLAFSAAAGVAMSIRVYLGNLSMSIESIVELHKSSVGTSFEPGVREALRTGELTYDAWMEMDRAIRQEKQSEASLRYRERVLKEGDHF